jgi:flagellar protein FlaF
MNPYVKQQANALGTSPQQAEAWALTTAARKLAEAKVNGEQETILAAVRLNWRLWTIFQANLVDPECAVPSEIRVNLLRLANFVDKRSVELLADTNPGKLDVLININRQIASGLLGDGRSQPGAAPAAASVHISAA